MGLLILFIIISAIGLAGPDPRRAAGDDPNPPGSASRFYQPPGRPNLTHSCRGRVYSPSGHGTTCDAFAPPAKPSKVVAYCRRELGDGGFAREGEGGRRSLPAEAPRPGRVLEVSGVGTDDPSRQCEKRPAAEPRASIPLPGREGGQAASAAPPPDHGAHPTPVSRASHVRRVGAPMMRGVMLFPTRKHREDSSS